MKRQISNTRTVSIQWFFYFIGILPVCMALVLPGMTFSFSGKQTVVFTSVLLLHCLCSLYYGSRFFIVQFDYDAVYASRNKGFKKIKMENITRVTPFVIPFRVLYGRVYLLTIDYIENDHNKIIRFLSKPVPGPGTISDIPYLDTLRQLIKEKRYNG